MNTQFRCVGCLAALVCVASLAGCTPDNRPKTTAVTCTVIYKGEPVEGASVAFLPAMSATGRTAEGAVAAAGVTDSSGKAQLRAFPEKLGAVPGEYSVIIQKLHPEDDTLQKGSTIPQAHITSLIPGKYSDYRTSGFKATVGTEALDVTYTLTD